MTTLDERAMRGEVSDSRLLTTSYGLNASSFACPFSEANDNVVRAVSKDYTVARLTRDFDDLVGYYPEPVKKEKITVKTNSLDGDFQTIAGKSTPR
jgi:hypothetical protein